MSRIFKFIGTILIGKILQRIVDWMSDPKNEGKLDAIGNFLKVTWPAILGAFLIFATGFGGIITTLIAMVGKFIPKIAATIARLAASNPLAAAAIAGAGLFVAGAVVPKLFPGTVDEQERKTEEEPGTKEEKITKLKEQKKNLNSKTVLRTVISSKMYFPMHFIIYLFIPNSKSTPIIILYDLI